MALEKLRQNERADDVWHPRMIDKEAVELGPAGLKVVAAAGQDVKS